MQDSIHSLEATTIAGDLGRKSTVDATLIVALQRIVGRSNVITGMKRTRAYCTGFRFGRGPVLAVVRPGSLVEQWRILRAVIAAKKIVIMQAANTGLTGGSTPDGDGYNRGIVLINTMRLAGIHLINQGSRWYAGDILPILPTVWCPRCRSAR